MLSLRLRRFGSADGDGGGNNERRDVINGISG